MKIFVQVCRNFEGVGISPTQKHSLNERNVLAIFFYGQFVLSTFVFLCLEAKNAEEYANGFYAFATGFGPILGITTCIRAMGSVSELFTDMENFIKKSSCRKPFRLI